MEQAAGKLKKHRNKCSKQQEEVRGRIEQDCAAAQTQEEEDESRRR